MSARTMLAGVDTSTLTDPRLYGVVYGLIDPRTPERVGYVGVAEGHVFGRYLHHLADAGRGDPERSPRIRFIAGLADLRLQPALVILEAHGAGIGRTFLRYRELIWIARLQARGEAWANAPLRQRTRKLYLNAEAS